MYSYGNQVPGYRRTVAASSPPPAVAAPPPSPPMGNTLREEPYADSPPPPELAPEAGQYAVPPEVYVEESPRFIYSPSLQMYVAVGVPYDLVYNGYDYFYLYGGSWYRGPYYNGPWSFAGRRYLPPGLRRYRADEIRYFRDQEYRRYEHDRNRYDGRFYRPDYRGERRR
jgi:hypothetical protein